MKKTKKILISTISIILVIVIGTFIFYHYFYDANKLNLKEKTWLDDNKTNIISINVPNDLNVYGLNGSGLFYDFIDDFAKYYELTINKNVVSSNSNNSLGLSKSNNPNELLMGTDHYVIVSKNFKVVTKVNDISNDTIGMLDEGNTLVSSSYKINSKIAIYETRDKLLDALKNDSVAEIVVPLNEYIDSILSNNYQIIYHLSSVKNYYYLHLGSDETLNSIIKKYYNIWSTTKLEQDYYENNYKLFVDKLGLKEVETDGLTNKTYSFGFVPSIAYASLSGSKYGGIIFEYLNDFSKFSNVDFTFTKYNDYNKLLNAYANKDVDLIFNNNDISNKDYLINSNLNNKFYLVSNLKNNYFYNNINDVKEEVYVIKNSLIANYFNDIKNLKVNYVDNEKKLIKAYNRGYLIAIDSNTYNNLINKTIKNSYIAFSSYSKANYGYRYLKNNDAFYKLFSSYVNFIDPNTMINKGMLSYKNANAAGSIISLIAKYVLVIVSVSVVIIGIVIASKKHLKLDTKIRKDEKLKFVDMLTSLKNRNYLNEKIKVWNQNTIYPQSVIVIDLNNIKYLNDTYGHVEGDKQIKATANALIKTQLDNTEIMRTDGNEFMVYLVGYNEKQVINYIKKLLKEFKDLPYDYGAAIGFSMIVDDLKLLDDAINEATIQMRNNKEAIEAQNETKEN